LRWTDRVNGDFGVWVWGCTGCGEHTKKMGGDSGEWSMKRERKQDKNNRGPVLASLMNQKQNRALEVLSIKKQTCHTCDT